MSQLTVILIAIAATAVLFFFLLAAAAAAFYIYRQKKKEADSKKKELEVSSDFVTAVNKLADVAKQLQDLPKLLAGQTRVAKAFVIEVHEFRKATEQFREIIMGKAEKPEKLLTTSTEADASKAFVISELMAENPEWDREQAAQMAESALTSRADVASLGLE